MPVNPPSYTSSDRTGNPSILQSGSDSERNGLLPQAPNYGSMPISVRKTSHNMTKLLGTVVLLLIGLNIATFFSPSMARSAWNAEQRSHQALRNSWSSERNAMAVEREEWQKERVDRRLEREELAAERERWRKERIDSQNRDREELEAEKERWRRERTARVGRERKELAEEREQWRKERADHDNRERQEEEAKRALMFWQDLRPSSRCLRYGAREYSATLANVPLGLDPLKECWNKSIDIHGRPVLPSRCDTQGACGTVVGHWVIDFNEATCVTWWRGYDNKGCVERGIHRYESVLENLQDGDDWHEMCATTPGHVQGRDFPGPTSCASWRSGINAIWLVEDENCY